ncbi:MAG: hypothetical protein R3D89_00300 [Sphingomonadaceae bacterium]
MSATANRPLAIVFAAIVSIAAWSMTVTVPANAALPGHVAIALA